MLLSLELALRACSRTASLAALLLFLRRPAPTGTLRSVPPAVQYLWQPCMQAAQYVSAHTQLAFSDDLGHCWNVAGKHITAVASSW